MSSLFYAVINVIVLTTKAEN